MSQVIDVGLAKETQKWNLSFIRTIKEHNCKTISYFHLRGLQHACSVLYYWVTIKLWLLVFFFCGYMIHFLLLGIS